MWDRMKEKRNEGGFTLIELLIVIIILAILAAIVVFAVGTSGGNAATASCQADAKSTETALEAYKALIGSYPPVPATWTQANYNVTTVTAPSGFGYLDTQQGSGSATSGPWLKTAPGTQYYTILFDANGNVYVGGPATYGATDSAATEFDSTPTICDTASATPAGVVVS